MILRPAQEKYRKITYCWHFLRRVMQSGSHQKNDKNQGKYTDYTSSRFKSHCSKVSLPSASSRPVEVKLRVKYDFISRNQRELNVTKGEIVDVSICFPHSQNNNIFNRRPTNLPSLLLVLFSCSFWTSRSSGGK